MRKHDGHKPINKTDGPKGRGKRQLSKVRRQRAKALLRRIRWLEKKCECIDTLWQPPMRTMYLGALNEARKIYVEFLGGSRRDWR